MRPIGKLKTTVAIHGQADLDVFVVPKGGPAFFNRAN